MNYKVNNLKEKIYKNFITGVYGEPKIPSDNEIVLKMTEITDKSYSPITNNIKLNDITLSGITSKFSNIIDDVGVLFSSIESESKDVLDQLTSSLQEHNTIKRELKRISTTNKDINDGKFGEELLEYNYTESFDDTRNINTVKSSPIDTDAGVFTIRDNSSNIVNMNHYINKKLQINVIKNTAPIVEQGYVGDSNAENILSKNNPKNITYRAKLSRPVSLTFVTSIQLMSDSSPVEINSVIIGLDSGISKGFIKLYYQNGLSWKDIPNLNIKQIKGDVVSFSFSSVLATHIKLEFIKDSPDVPTTNEYYVSVYELVVGKSSTRASAVLYSKPVKFVKYDNEAVLINNISCVVDADIPTKTSVKLYIAADKIVSGRFIDSYGNTVYSDSSDTFDFNPAITGYVYLSEIVERVGLSGLEAYKLYDFDWKEIKPFSTTGDTIPETIEFNFSSKKSQIVNSLFNQGSLLRFGDRLYTGPWPEDVSYTGVYVSGWCNSTNPAWSTVLSTLVDSGVLTSGIDVATLLGIPWNDIAIGNGKTINDAGYESGIYSGILEDSNWSGQWLGYGSGYPFSYFSDTLDRDIRFGDYAEAHNGWWRPYGYLVTPTGISESVSTSGYLNHDIAINDGDFYFNGLSFYKIYKFGATDLVLDSSIKLYQYEERPVERDSDTYSHIWTWKYLSSSTNEVGTLLNQYDSIHQSSGDFNDYVITFPALKTNEEYTDNSVLEVRQSKTNFVLSPNTDYHTTNDSNGNLSGISLAPLSTNYPSYSPVGITFDIKYSYKITNRYLSTWTTYAIVSPNINSNLEITNPTVYDNKDLRIIKEIIVENKDTGIIETNKGDAGNFVINFNTVGKKTNTHYKLSMFCLADEDTGFSAKLSSGSNFIPRETTSVMSVPGGIKLVAKLESFKICDLSNLLYDTPMANDRKCALISDYGGEKYLVIKKPLKSNFPGYIYDQINKNHSIRQDALITNKSHYIREGYDASYNSIIYTTGSSGITIYDSLLIDKDTTWNDGTTYEAFKNTDQTSLYPNYSTYGHKINLEPTSEITFSNLVLTTGDTDPRTDVKAESVVGSAAWIAWISVYDPTGYAEYTGSGSNSYTINGTCKNRGYLFYNTAENLPAVYSIAYSTIVEYTEIANRVLYKLEIESDENNAVVPVVRSIRLIANKRPS